MTHRLVLLLDFDGTVCIGDGPVRAYADAVVTALATDDPAGHEKIAATLRAGLDAYLAGTPDDLAEIPADGYAAVTALAEQHASPAQLEAAYAVSREALATTGAGAAAPEGLRTLLDELAGRVERVLVTNAPARGVTETLDRLGLADAFDAVITDAEKPTGWARLLPDLLADRPAHDVLAVGDVWRNDIEPPLAAGCATALIDRFGRTGHPAHAVARTFPELFPAVRAWVADPRAFVVHRDPHATTGARPTPLP